MAQTYFEIIEQPARNAVNFQLEDNRGFSEPLIGVSSTPAYQTYPAVRVVGPYSKADVLISCVTIEHPYLPHPYKLVSEERSLKGGMCSIKMVPEYDVVLLHDLRIKRVKRKQFKKSLLDRGCRVHKLKPLDYCVVRLLFFVVIYEEYNDQDILCTQKVLSDPIYHKSTNHDLRIAQLSKCVVSADGGRDNVILLCEKVDQEIVEIRFYEEHDNRLVWERFGYFEAGDVHQNSAISFQVPPYHKLNIEEPAKVLVQLRRPSDGTTSNSVPFQYLPLKPKMRYPTIFEERLPSTQNKQFDSKKKSPVGYIKFLLFYVLKNFYKYIKQYCFN